MKLFYRLTPHHRLSRNPLFAFEVRRIRWGASAETLIAASLSLVIGVCASVLVMWLLLLVISASSYQATNSGYLSLLLLGLNLLLSLVLDYSSMSNALGSISGEITRRRWELLRLTPLTLPQIVAAKYGAAQVRSWRWMMWIVALRLAAALVAVLTIIIRLFSESHYTEVLFSSYLITLLLGTTLAAIYGIEPYWRMRAIVALGVAISARARDHTTAVLIGIGSLVTLWLAQAVILLALALLTSVLIVPIALVEATINPLIFCSPLLLLALVVATIYGFYSVIQTWSLRRAARRILN